MNDSTTAVLRHADRALTGAARALLLEGLGAGTRDLAATLGLVRALAGGGALRNDDLVDERNVGLHVEGLGGKLNGADLLALRVDDVKFGSHGTRPPSLRCERKRYGRELREPRP